MNRAVNDAAGRQGTREWFRRRRADIAARIIRYPRLTPLIVLMVTAMFTGIAVAALERSAATSERIAATETANAISAAIERRATAYVAVLRAAAILFETLDRVPPEVFSRYIEQDVLDTRVGGAQGIGWTPTVRPGTAQAFVAARHAEGQPDFQIWPDANAPRVMQPIVELQPHVPDNVAVIGFDMASEPNRRVAMARAALTGMPVSSAPVHLAQDRHRAALPGFLIYMPVYDTAALAEGAPRPAALRGFVYSPFPITAFIRAARSDTRLPDANFRILDGEQEIVRNATPFVSDRPVRTSIAMAGRMWTLEVDLPETAPLTPLSRFLLGTGIVVGLLVAALSSIVIGRAQEEAAATERQRQQENVRTALTRELNHRVKNTLTNVLSIANLTRRNADNVDDYVDGLIGRIGALSATHDLLTSSDWSETLVSDIVAAELAPYRGDIGDADGAVDRITMDGPEVALAPSDALSLGLAIHELATNAAKYGALSVAEGRVAVHWSLESDTCARLIWTEANGPLVNPRTRTGFGSTLIERIIARELKNKVSMEFRPEGVRCTLFLPVRERQAFRIRAGVAG